MGKLARSSRETPPPIMRRTFLGDDVDTDSVRDASSHVRDRFIKAYIDRTVADKKMPLFLDQLCATLYGPERCASGMDANGGFWKYACEKMGITSLDLYAKAPTTWRDTYTKLVEQASSLKPKEIPNEIPFADADWAEVKPISAHLLRWCARYNMALLMVYLAHLGADVDEYLRDGPLNATALIHSALNGQIDCVQVLLHLNAKANLYTSPAGIHAYDRDLVSRHDALYFAAEYGYTEIAKLLLTAGADVNSRVSNGNSALCAACRGGHAMVAKLLIDQGADVNKRPWYDNVFYAARSIVYESPDYKITHGYSPLMYASKNGMLDVVEALLAVPDIDVNATGSVMFAGDTNRNDKDIDEKDKDGVEYTALMWASAKGHLEIVKALLDAGAEVNTSLEGRTALDWATLRGHDDVAQALRQGRGDETRD